MEGVIVFLNSGVVTFGKQLPQAPRKPFFV